MLPYGNSGLLLLQQTYHKLFFRFDFRKVKVAYKRSFKFFKPFEDNLGRKGIIAILKFSTSKILFKQNTFINTSQDNCFLCYQNISYIITTQTIT